MDVATIHSGCPFDRVAWVDIDEIHWLRFVFCGRGLPLYLVLLGLETSSNGQPAKRLPLFVTGELCVCGLIFSGWYMGRGGMPTLYGTFRQINPPGLFLGVATTLWGQEGKVWLGM